LKKKKNKEEDKFLDNKQNSLMAGARLDMIKEDEDEH